MQTLDTIGRAELIDLLDFDLHAVPAKVDTGADSSAIWASRIQEGPKGLSWVFFGPDSAYYTGGVVHLSRGYKTVRVTNSFGQIELRYKVRLRIGVKGRVIRATFTLADRSSNTYPVLLGRRLLQGKFLVDVSQGDPACSSEKLRANRRHHTTGTVHHKRGEQ